MSLMTSLGVERLSKDEQLRLVEEILDGINDPLTEVQRHELDRSMARLEAEGLTPMPEEELTLTDEQKQVFQRRISELHANPGIGLTWEQIKARIKGGK